jgi:hypothetical protein
VDLCSTISLRFEHSLIRQTAEHAVQGVPIFGADRHLGWRGRTEAEASAHQAAGQNYWHPHFCQSTCHHVHRLPRDNIRGGAVLDLIVYGLFSVGRRTGHRAPVPQGAK